jgi:DNA-directed RNA polymerase specialized sigma24 family protein
MRFAARPTVIDEKVKAKERQIARQVRDAVAADDPCGFLEALESGGVLAGHKHGLKTRFRHLDDSDLDRILGECPDELFQAMQKRTIPDPLAYLYKVMCNRCALLDAARNLEVPLDRDHGKEPETVDSDREERWARHCAAGFTEVRRMIRLLSSEKQRQVIGYYIDALEKGYVDLTAAEVAAGLGITEVYVRQLKKRAIDRLRDMAQEEGLDLNFDFGSFDAFYEARDDRNDD